ncbi:zona pellucida sperm-binding protein 3-like [Thalassophryne amazonica]|uniref:zona pellucida sperm-binding protein 3-like n=1 Tax=Thalassophryne amazonica TaxID=390379 RepID=UPI001471D50A|nr:zona pellucida sperm-binding protein 3-like [Thalassophryne amazonica]
MATLNFWLSLHFGAFLLFPCLISTLLPSQHAFRGPPQLAGGVQQHEKESAAGEGREQVNTVSVVCYPDALEVTVKPDMYANGIPVNADDLQLGVEPNKFCKAAPSAGGYRIIAGLHDCGTKHWMTEESLVYTNLLMYSPEASGGVIRMDPAVIPIECHYDRRYSLSSASITPTWIPFRSTQTAVETLAFDLKLMTADWLYERSSHVFYLGEPIYMEASVRVGHHMGLRVFLGRCVATLDKNIEADPRYTFIDNGCLLDSQLPGSRSHFLPRVQDNKLQLVIDAFKFHNEAQGQLYVTCHMTAVAVNDAEVTNKACTFINGRWQSADGNDYLCGYCPSQNKVDQSLGKSGLFGPRGFQKSEASWRSGRINEVWEDEEQLGPLYFIPVKQSGPLPEEAVPVLHKVSTPRLFNYGSHWRSGLNFKSMP